MSFNGRYVPPDSMPESMLEMREYLINHPRYPTANSWNQANSYARGIKLQWLKFLNQAVADTAYEVLGADEPDWVSDSGISELLAAFSKRHHYEWQINTNGRSGGYYVLYQGGCRPGQHRSYCTLCGQKNFCEVAELPTLPGSSALDMLQAYVIRNNHWTPETYVSQDYVKTLGLLDATVIDNIRTWRKTWAGKPPRVTYHKFCGKCNREGRVNYKTPQIETFCYPGRGTDMDPSEFREWDESVLRSRVETVLDFDWTVNACITAFTEYCESVQVEDEEVVRTVTRRVIKQKE